MTNILNEPIKVQSLGGSPVKITGVDPSTNHCIVGTITYPGKKAPEKVAWDLNGVMRGGDEPLNLDMRIDELKDLTILIRHLGYEV